LQCERGLVEECRTCDHKVRISPVADVYQRQLSVPSLLGRSVSTIESCGSTQACHTMH